MFVSGELIEEMCDVYCGLQSDLEYNPRIRTQPHKHVNLDLIGSWNNPRTIFCHTHRLPEFIAILPKIQNPFVLVTHNSDGNITGEYRQLLEDPKLLFWHAQNVMYEHPKLGGIPIGIANRMWPHGNQYALANVLQKGIAKTNLVYFQFSLHTNPAERKPCFHILSSKGLVWQAAQNFAAYLETLASYKYAICPPGNGVDCHRIWECIYLNVIPILLRSVFTEKVNKVFPCILLNTWEEFDVRKLEEYTPNYTLSLDRIQECLRTNTDYFSQRI